ncbi:hypothetical protein LIA77_08254 [Sarocladium implicatum]|nr:hypothetical protein LIA77_08254 [Sarocladium implicatum]
MWRSMLVHVADDDFDLGPPHLVHHNLSGRKCQCWYPGSRGRCTSHRGYMVPTTRYIQVLLPALGPVAFLSGMICQGLVDDAGADALVPFPSVKIRQGLFSVISSEATPLTL